MATTSSTAGATVYANQKIMGAEVGTHVSEFGSDEADYVIKPASGPVKFVKGDYALEAGDTLFVTQQGVAG